MVTEEIIGKGSRMTVCRLVAPQDGGLSLIPMEGLLRGLRGPKDVMSLELSGNDGVVEYNIRTNNGRNLMGMLQSWFPQVRVERRDNVMGGWEEVEREWEQGKGKDWLHLREGEFAMVRPLGLAKESYLPLRMFEDDGIRQSGRDPLAGLIGQLASLTRGSEGPKGRGDRLGVRLVIRPAKEDWSRPWQDRMQMRRDGDDKVAKGPMKDDGGPSFGVVVGVGGLAGVLAANWWVYDNLGWAGVVPLNLLGVLGVAGGAFLLGKLRGGRNRMFMDEMLVDAKLKSLAFWAELQVIRVFPSVAEEEMARQSLDEIVDCLRGFDDPAGNSWKEGKTRVVSGSEVAGGLRAHPFLGGKGVLDWVDVRRSSRTALSAREVASLWHLPLGVDEMAPMERTASAVLVPHLAELGEEGEDTGPLVGMSGGRRVWLPESAIRKHSLVMGRSGVGKSTLMKHVVYHKLVRKSKGLDNDAIVVVDPHADLVRDIVQMIPENLVPKVRLLDFGRADRVPGINLLDPQLFPGRDRCVDTIIETVKHLWEHWGGRLEDLLKRSLTAIYEFNEHKETSRDEMLTMLDILPLLDGGITSGSGPNAKTEMSPFQRHVMSRVNDAQIKMWFQGYLGWDRATRSEAVGPVYSRVGAYAANMRSKVIMGQRESTILLRDVLREGLVLLVSTAQGTVGQGPAALMGGTMVSLVESALRDQEMLPFKERSRCLIVCDEFQTVTGANWEGLLSEGRKYGCVLMLATQSLARLDTPERKLKAGILGNVGVIVGYQMSAEDARIIAPEMDIEKVQERDLGNLDPHHCIVRVNSAKRCYPAFTLETLPPPEETNGSEASVKAVLAASEAYTVDLVEAGERMNRELEQRLEGEKAGLAVGGGGDGAKSIFQESMETVAKRREAKGPLKHLKEEDIEKSRFSRQALETVVSGQNDAGMRAAVNKVLGDQAEAERRKVRAEERGKIEEEVRSEAQGALAAEWEKLEAARADMGKQLVVEREKVAEETRREVAAGSRAEVAAELVRERQGPRSLGDLKRVGPGNDSGG